MRLIGPLLLLVLPGCGPPPAADVPAAEVIRVEAEVQWAGETVESAASADPAVIRAVLDAAQPVGTPPAHKCSAAGRLTLTRRSGEPVRLFFLPGHDERFYEYYDGRGAYQVDRAAFVAALQGVGLKRVPVECGRPPAGPAAAPPPADR